MILVLALLIAFFIIGLLFGVMLATAHFQKELRKDVYFTPSEQEYFDKRREVKHGKTN